MPATAKTTMCFWTTGEALTELFRDRMLEDQNSHEAAARLIVESLDGMTWDIAYDILVGKKKLVGDSRKPEDRPEGVGAIELADTDPRNDESDREYAQKLSWLFAGCVREYGRIWQPYACVTGYGKTDMMGSSVMIRQRGGQRFVTGRATHYMDDPHDIVRNMDHPDENGMVRKLAVLWRPSNLPPWMKPRASNGEWGVALADYLVLRGPLEYRSHQKWYGDILPLEEEDAPRLDELLERSDDREGERLSVEEEDRRYLARIAGYRGQVRKQAGPDEDPACDSPLDGPWFTLRVSRKCGNRCDPYLLGDGVRCSKHPPENRGKPREYRVPSAPFIGWALNRTRASHLIPDWKPVTPSGMKLRMDEPYHTDWMLGAGLSIENDYSDAAIVDAAHNVLFMVQRKLCEFKAAVLSGRGKFVGFTEVVHPEPDQDCSGKIAVIPNAGPKYTIPAMSALAVITERGGELAHLSVVGREQGIILVRVKDARRLYPEGCKVQVDASHGEVELDTTRLSIFGGND